MKTKHKTLAIPELDIAELEQRIELANAAMATAAWGGGCSTNCGFDCENVCSQLYICDPNLIP